MSYFIEVDNLKKYYPVLGGLLKRKIADVRAVDGVNLGIEKSECFGLVGESGCGKTTLGKTIIRLFKPNSGHIYFAIPEDAKEKIKQIEKENPRSGELKRLRRQYDLAVFRRGKLKPFRRKMQMVYQDPTRSLNPRMLVKDIVAEPLQVQGLAKGEERRKRVMEILYKVGLTESHLFRYPHEFSGGQRQRIAVARALVTNPEFVVLDEPTSSVDVSVRAQLLDLLQKLSKDMGLTYLYISHDLSVVECIANRVAVMYVGKIVELANTVDLYKNPLHPYSTALFSAIPIPDPYLKRKRVLLTGEVPSAVNPPSGCRFHLRCPKAMEVCQRVEPQLIDVGNNHFVACHLY
jgi:oligopeptide/dipeptide ABC transporter ATP-binding protein